MEGCLEGATFCLWDRQTDKKLKADFIYDSVAGAPTAIACRQLCKDNMHQPTCTSVSYDDQDTSVACSSWM